jgi:hypothetical protein
MSNRRHPDLNLDDEIKQVEARIEARRAELIYAAEEAKERVRSTIARPTTLLIALGVGFLAARVARSTPRPHATVAPQSTFQRFASTALSAGITRLLPLAMGPLQGLAAQWLGRRFG